MKIVPFLLHQYLKIRQALFLSLQLRWTLKRQAEREKLSRWTQLLELLSQMGIRYLTAWKPVSFLKSFPSIKPEKDTGALKKGMGTEEKQKSDSIRCRIYTALTIAQKLEQQSNELIS